MKLALGLIAAALVCLPAQAQTAPCPASAWRLNDGTVIDIGSVDSDGSRRWRKFDGTTGRLTATVDDIWMSSLGWTGRADGKSVALANCQTGVIRFDGVEARHVELDVQETTFKVKDADLKGRLVMPKKPDKGTDKVPIVVLLHGSEDWSAADFNQLQRLLPAMGVGAFVFDKRGTGKSGGKYTQDYGLLADDAVAAMKEARRLAGARADRVGYYGPSQGGWVAPMAANRSKVDFVIVGFGLAVSPLEENRQEIRLEMTQRGHSAADIDKALEVAKAGETIVTSNLKDGFDEFDAARAKYRKEPWYADLHGNYTYMLLPLDKPTIQASPERFVLGTLWKYDPMPALRASKTPQLWILGEDDLQAPSADTGAKIAALGQAGKPFTLAVFPRAMHGVYEYETTASGDQVSTRNPDGFFVMLRDYAMNGALKGQYGQAAITRPKGRKS